MAFQNHSTSKTPLDKKASKARLWVVADRESGQTPERSRHCRQVARFGHWVTGKAKARKGSDL